MHNAHGAEADDAADLPLSRCKEGIHKYLLYRAGGVSRSAMLIRQRMLDLAIE